MKISTVRPEVIDLCARVDVWVTATRLAQGGFREASRDGMALSNAGFSLLIDGGLNYREQRTLACEMERLREHLFLLVESRMEEATVQSSGKSS